MLDQGIPLIFLCLCLCASVVHAAPDTPVLTGASYLLDEQSVSVIFNSDVTYDGRTAAFPCGTLFSFTGVETATCRWKSYTEAMIKFPTDGSDQAAVGDTLVLYGSVLRARCPDDYLTPNECAFFPTLDATSVTITVKEPRLLSAVFFPDGSILRVTFDYSVTYLGWSRNFPCGFLFDYAGALISTCQWVSYTVIDVTFPAGTSYGAVVGDTFVTFPGVMIPKCAESYPGYDTCTFLAPLPQYSVPVTAATGSPPTVLLPAQLTVSSCLSPVIDASSSYGSGGRKWVSADVKVATISSTGPELEAYMVRNSSVFVNSQPMEIPIELIESGFTYDITLTLCNFLGVCGFSTMKLMVEANPVPIIVIQQGSLVTVARDRTLNLYLSYSLPFCDGTVLPTSQMGFNWTISTGGGVLTSIKSTTKDKTKYQLKPYTLQSETRYSVVSTVWNKRNPTQISSVTTIVDVTKAPVRAIIIGNEDQSLPFDSTLLLDGSTSRDLDVSTGDSPPALSYAWTCQSIAPTIQSSCPSLSITGSSSSVLAIEYTENNFVAEEYILTLLVTDPSANDRNSSASVSVSLLAPLAPEVKLSKSITTRKVNSFQSFRLSAAVTLKATEAATWSVNDSNVALSNVWSLPATRTLLPGTHSLVGALALSKLDAGVPYKFSLTCGSTVSSVVVLVNLPPVVGQFVVSPASGVEITDVFTFSTAFWTDEDTPISYEFGFVTADLSKLVVQAAAPSSSTKTVLPAGAAQSNYILVCSAKAYDSLGAFSSAMYNVEVRPFSGNELASALTTSLEDAGTLDSLKRTISVSSTVLNTGNCVRSPDCAVLNRYACSQVTNTCGACLDAFVGEAGSANSPCISEDDYSTLTDQDENCYVDEHCPTWKKCDSETLTCVVAPKKCNWDCSGHGACLMVSVSDQTPVDTCFMNDFTCAAICECDTEYFGYSCNSTSDAVEEYSSVRGVIMGKLEESVDLDDFTLDSSISLISMLKAASQDSFTLNEESSQVAVTIGDTLMGVASELGIPIDDMRGMLDALESVLLTYTPSSTRRKLKNLDADTLNGILEILENYGSTIANQWLAAGNSRSDTVLNQFTTSANVFYADSAEASTSTANSGVSGFQSHSISFLSDPKDMQVLTTVMQSKLYPMASELNSNPLKLTVKASNASSTVRFTIHHNKEITFEKIPSNITFRTTCVEYSSKEETFTCPDNFEIFHKCNGTESVLVSRCRGTKEISVCRAVDIFGFGPNVNCEVEEHTGTTTTCVCQVRSSGRRRLSGVSDTGYLEIAAMSEQAVDEFEGTLYESKNFNSVDDLEDVFTVIILFASMWIAGILGSYYFSLRGAMDQTTKKNMNQILRDTRLNALAKNSRSVDSIKRYMNNYIDQVFPNVYGALPWYKRLVKEVLRHHRYMCLFAGDSTPKERFTTTVHLLTIQTMLMFMLAVFYDIQFPVDDGSCDNLSASTCEDEKSVFNTKQSMCQWHKTDGYCEWNEPNIGWEVVIIISIVVAVFTAPVNLVVDFLFNEVLTAPTADSLKLQEQDSAMKRAGRRVSSAVRRASTHAASAVSSAMNSASNAVGFEKNKNQRKNMRITTTRLIPGDTMTAQSLAMASTSSVADSFKQSRDSFRAHRETLVGRNTVAASNNASIAVALANADDPTISSIALFSEFERELYAQREALRVAERPAFDESWGLSSNGLYAEETRRSALSCRKSDPPREIVKSEIVQVQKEAHEKYDKLKLASDSHVGLELLHVFVLDLLGRETPAAKIFISKSSADFRHAMVVSKLAKRIGWFVIAVLNIFFVYFAMLRGMQRGRKWQEGYAFACAIQFLVEIFMFETTECIWMNYLIPDAASTEIQAIKFQLRRTVDNLCSVSTTTYKYFLDAPEYFFVSSVLAKRFPDKLESMIISSYHQHLPGELSKKWKNGSARNSRASRFLRNMSLFAIMNWVMQLIGTAPPTFQRVAVHSVQPLLFAAFAIFVIFLVENPIFAAVFALPVLYQLCIYLYNYATTGVAFPKSDDDEPAHQHDRKHGASMSHHNSVSHHSSMYAADHRDNAVTNALSVPTLPASIKPNTPPNAVMPLSMANAITSQDTQSHPTGPVKEKKNRNSATRKTKKIKPAADGSENYAAVGPIERIPSMEMKPSSGERKRIGQEDVVKKTKKTSKVPKGDKKSKKKSASRSAATTISKAEPKVNNSVSSFNPRIVVFSDSDSESSDISGSSHEDYACGLDAKKWEQK